MSKCDACQDTVRQADKIVCSRSTCTRSFHLLCVGMSTKSSKKPTSWICPDCTSKIPKTGNNTNTPVRNITQQESPGTDGCSYVTIRKQYTEGQAQAPSSNQNADFMLSIRDELLSLVQSALKSELGPLHKQVTAIETSISYLSSQYDDLIKTLKSTSAEVKSLKAENVRLRSDLDVNTARMQSLEDELARQQQWSRLQNIELVGVPESKDEDTMAVVISVVNKTGMELNQNDLEFAHRVQPIRPTSAAIGRTIIARFRHRRTKDLVIASTRKHRGIKPSDIGMGDKGKTERNIYINEHLTKTNKSLLKQCKLKIKESNYKFVWTKNCRIYVRKNETSPPISISTAADLMKIA